jgi:hypothetical protein
MPCRSTAEGRQRSWWPLVRWPMSWIKAVAQLFGFRSTCLRLTLDLPKDEIDLTRGQTMAGGMAGHQLSFFFTSWELTLGESKPTHSTLMCSHLVVGCSIVFRVDWLNRRADHICSAGAYKHRVDLSSPAVTVTPLRCLHTPRACGSTQTQPSVKRWRPGPDVDLTFLGIIVQ